MQRERHTWKGSWDVEAAAFSFLTDCLRPKSLEREDWVGSPPWSLAEPMLALSRKLLESGVPALEVYLELCAWYRSS